MSILGWIATLAIATAASIMLFPLAFPLAPGTNWQLRKSEAIAVATERLSDLGALPAGATVTAVLAQRHLLELQLLVQQANLERRAAPQTAELADGLFTWLVTVYPPSAGPDAWAYQVELTLDGRVVRLLSGVVPDFRSRVQLTVEDAVSRADRLLERSGRQLADFYAPVERLVEMTDFSYQLLRYERRPPVAGSQDGVAAEEANQAGATRQFSVHHGVDVQFAGDELLGFFSWEELEADDHLEQGLRRVQQLELAQFLVVFLGLAMVGVVFVRRYHQGLVGARRGTQIALLIAAAAFVVLVMTASSVTEGLNFSGLSRVETTAVWVGLLSIVYLPALAVLGGLSFAVGESLARGTWRLRLASFDALLSLRWANATIAASSLRGVAMGMVLAVCFLAAVLLSRHYGVLVPFSLQLGPGWESAEWPGVGLLLSQLAFTTVALCFSLLFVLPVLTPRIGLRPSALVATAALGALFFAPLATVPAWGSLSTVLLSSAAIVALFLRYDLLVAWLAHLVASVGVGALALLEAGDSVLRLQGAAVLLLVAAPLWASLRHVSTGKLHEYEYDEVPPHVRKIAERERQRVELETARGIQTSILPALPQTLCGAAIAYSYQPASEVGGDFYDVIALEDGRLAIAIGDVAGHGVSSGLIMSMVRAALVVQVRFAPEVDDVLPALNSVVFGSARKRLLTTLCYALLDPWTGQLSYACAGHIYPYLLRVDGDVVALPSTSYPLGVRPDLQPDCCEVTLEPGDTLFFTTDGLIEGCRLGGTELFGFERLEASLRKLVGETPQTVLAGVLSDLEHFSNSGRESPAQSLPRADDLTLLVLRLPDRAANPDMSGALGS